jgi:hypothetical protein
MPPKPKNMHQVIAGWLNCNYLVLTKLSFELVKFSHKHTVMKKTKNNYFIFCISLFAVISVAFTSSVNQVKLLPVKTFAQGESVEYRVHYGFITAGEATMRVNKSLVKVGKQPCFKIEVEGRTTGAFDKFLSIKDIWGTMLDTGMYHPLQSYRLIEEGNYRLKEVVNYDYTNKKAIVSHNDEKREVKLPGIVQDMVSGYYYFRLVDYSQLREGDVINVTGMFEEKVYNLKVKYSGKERIKTKFGRINAIVLTPQLPENKLFDGENAVQFFISDDQNRIPLKIRAELVVGAVELDIKGYTGLKYPIKFG